MSFTKGYTGAAPKFKPARDRHVKVIELAACPVCEAEIKQHCRKLDGSPGPVSHAPRRRLAVRIDNAARGI